MAYDWNVQIAENSNLTVDYKDVFFSSRVSASKYRKSMEKWFVVESLSEGSRQEMAGCWTIFPRTLEPYGDKGGPELLLFWLLDSSDDVWVNLINDERCWYVADEMHFLQFWKNQVR